MSGFWRPASVIWLALSIVMWAVADDIDGSRYFAILAVIAWATADIKKTILKDTPDAA